MLGSCWEGASLTAVSHEGREGAEGRNTILLHASLLCVPSSHTQLQLSEGTACCVVERPRHPADLPGNKSWSQMGSTKELVLLGQLGLWWLAGHHVMLYID